MRGAALALLCGAIACGAETAGVRDISQEDFLTRPPAGATIVDVRTAEEFASGHVEGAVNIPHTELAGRISELDGRQDTPVVLYCERGGRAGKAASVLLDAGFSDVLHLAGDMSEWRTAGRPMVVPASAANETLRAQAAGIFGVLPSEAPNPANELTPARTSLGRMLYYDTRLSKNHDVACNSCHPLASFGHDGEATSPGHRGQRGGRNSPTVYNAAFHVSQFWDGRAANVEEQAEGPVLNPIEMAMPSEEAVVAVLASIPGYVDAFAAAFPEDTEPLSYENMARAIGAFERKLATPGRFDAFLAGDLDALTVAELAGLQAFIETGCITCHIGPTVGGTLYQKLGVVKEYETADQGRFEVTGEEAHRKLFKVPSLRNIAETAPYFHDGSIASLEEVVKVMAEYQLGKELTSQQNASIRAFLTALTGEVDEAYIAMPNLPESGPGTPAPDPS